MNNTSRKKSFTFQSGYIQIDYTNTGSDKITVFTFQSGYIQIIYDLPSLVFLQLYIPIWLYSNEQGCARIAGLLAFTFQSGYIQIRIL